MPVYNGMPTIKFSINSLLNQTYKNWECIIVDDGSTDNTYEYLMSISDPRIKVFRFINNKGRAFARQKALEESKGKYLAMLDADDLYHPDKLKAQTDIMEANPNISLVCASMISFGYKTASLTKRGSQKDEIRIYSPNKEPLHAPSMLRTDHAKEFRYSMDLNFGEDRDFLSKYLSKYPQYMMLAKAYYYYSEYDSVSSKKILKSYCTRIKHYLNTFRLTDLAITALKYIYSLLTMPFVSDESIIKKRGWEVPETERIELESIIASIKKATDKE